MNEVEVLGMKVEHLEEQVRILNRTVDNMLKANASMIRSMQIMGRMLGLTGDD